MNGDLFYPNTTDNSNFTSWNPEFFGNTMLVNGVLWPKMTLSKTKHRFVILNACNSRFLNVYFDNNGKNLTFDLIRVDTDFYDEPVSVKELLATTSSRI